MTTARQVINSIKPNLTKGPQEQTQKGSVGYDNIRDDIEKTKSLREGTVSKTPAADIDIANKKYVDDNVGGAPEGTAVKSTGEGGGTKFLREDGDDTCSWQAPAGGGDVTAGANLTDETIVQGDGGAKGIKTSTATVAQIATNVTHTAGDGSDHADVATNTAASHAEAHNVASHSDTTITGAETETLSDGSDADALHAHATNDAHVAGDGSDHADVATNTTHRGLTNNPHSTTATHVSLGNVSNVATSDTAYNATSWNANTDASTKNAIRDKVETMNTAIGSNTTHRGTDGTADHSVVSSNKTHVDGDGSDHADVASNTTHRGDNTQAHSDYLKNDAVDVAVGLTFTGDNSSADTGYAPMMLYNTDDTPPAASGFPIGTIYIQYTA